MALQVRRGTNAERLSITPLAGELIYVTDTKQLYIGDGSTVGGTTTIAGTIDSLLADTSPQLGGNLDLNGNTIVGTGSININGTITATGNINLGDGAGDDVISLNGVISGNLLPQADITWNIGAPTFQFKEAWINQLNVENQITASRINASIIADDSTVVFDAISGTLAASALVGTFNGNIDGDVTGSVFADNSSLLVDAVTGSIVGPISTNTSVVVNGQTGTIGNGNPVFRSFGFNDPTIGRNAGSQLLISTARNDGVGNPASIVPGDTLVDIVADAYDGVGYKPAAVIKMGADKYTTISEGIVPGRLIFATYDNTGNFSIPNIMVWTSTGRLSIGSGDAPGAKLDVAGEVLLGRLTEAQRDALTPVNGMILYNTTANKFQGFENGFWVNLI